LELLACLSVGSLRFADVQPPSRGRHQDAQRSKNVWRKLRPGSVASGAESASAALAVFILAPNKAVTPDLERRRSSAIPTRRARASNTGLRVFRRSTVLRPWRRSTKSGTKSLAVFVCSEACDESSVTPSDSLSPCKYNPTSYLNA